MVDEVDKAAEAALEVGKCRRVSLVGGFVGTVENTRSGAIAGQRLLFLLSFSSLRSRTLGIGKELKRGKGAMAMA